MLAEVTSRRPYGMRAIRAATRIQAAFRGSRVRRALRRPVMRRGRAPGLGRFTRSRVLYSAGGGSAYRALPPASVRRFLGVGRVLGRR